MPKLTKQFFAGIDTGENGGIAIIDKNKFLEQLIQFPTEPETCARIVGQLKDLYGVNLHIVLERVTIMPFVGKSTAAKMLANLAKIETALHCFKMPYKLVLGKKWQENLKLPSRKGDKDSTTKGSDYKDRKELLRKKSMSTFPNLKIWEMETLEYQRAVCDALLIADYCRIEYAKNTNAKT